MVTQQRIGKVATTVSRESDGTLRVVYHSTAVVTVDPRGRITLDHGGWMTATTKTRMNQASNQLNLGFHVWQSACEWFVSFKGKTRAFNTRTCVLE